MAAVRGVQGTLDISLLCEPAFALPRDAAQSALQEPTSSLTGGLTRALSRMEISTGKVHL